MEVKETGGGMAERSADEEPFRRAVGASFAMEVARADVKSPKSSSSSAALSSVGSGVRYTNVLFFD